MLADLFLHCAKLWAKILHGWKLEINRIILLKIPSRRTCCFLLLILAYVTCMNLFDRYFSTSQIPCIYFIIRNIHKRIWSSEKLRLLNGLDFGWRCVECLWSKILLKKPVVKINCLVFFLEVLVCYVFVVSGNLGSKTATPWIFNKIWEKRTFVYVHHFKFQKIWGISF